MVGGKLQIHGRIVGETQKTSWSEPGEFSLVPAGLEVNYDLRGKVDGIVVHIGSRLIDQVALEVFDLDPGSFSIVPSLAQRDERTYLLAQQLAMEMDEPSAGSPLFAESITRALCLHLLRNYSSANKSRIKPRPGVQSGRVGRVVEFIHANLAGDISLDQLALISGISSSQIGRVFKLETGLSPYQYLIKLRSSAACELLGKTALSVTEIGCRCGFAQPSQFSTIFRRTLGMTPREYRNASRP